MNYRVINEGTHAPIEPGTTVKDFRGKAWVFESVARIPSEGKTGRVLLRDPETSPEDHFHYREFFPGVIDAVIMPVSA